MNQDTNRGEFGTITIQDSERNTNKQIKKSVYTTVKPILERFSF